MKKVVTTLVFCCAVLLLSACSSLDEFVIINRSDAPLEVVYAVKLSVTDKAPGKYQVEEPQVMGASELEKNDRPWRRTSKERCLIDHQAGKVMVRLAPGEALLVERTTNYQGHSSEYSDQKFNIASINLNGVRGSINLEGRQAQTQFQSKQYYYEIVYQ